MAGGQVGALSNLGDSYVVAWETTLGGATGGSTATGTGRGGFLFEVGGVISSWNIPVNLASAPILELNKNLQRLLIGMDF